MTAESGVAVTGDIAPTIRTVPFPRRLAVAGLVLGAAGNTAEAIIGQLIGDRPDTVAERMQMAAEKTAVIGTMMTIGTVAVPFMAIGFLAAAHLLRRRARRTATVAAVLLLAGMWGFVGVHVLELLNLAALNAPDPVAIGTFLDSLESDPWLLALFGVPFMAGAVLGMLTLTIGMLVTGAVPRWIPTTWLAFMVLDFSIGAVGPVNPHWLYLVGAVGLAVHIARRGNRAWANA